MKALIYLFIMTSKNKLLELKKKPAMLILYMIFILFFSILIISSLFSKDSIDINIKKLDIFYIIIAAVSLFYLYLNIKNGLQTGSTLFEMADVNHIFVAPISTKKVLIYGIINQISKLLIGSLFILYQIPNLRNLFHFGLKEILTLFILNIFILFFSQLISMIIYIYTNGNETRKKIIKNGFYLLMGMFALYIYYNIRLNNMNILDSVREMIGSSKFIYIPVVGWSVMLMKAVIESNLMNFMAAIYLFIAGSVLSIIFLIRGEADYYEDVLVSTEAMHEIKKALKDKNKNTMNTINTNVPSNKKIKVKESIMGLKWGQGAWTIASKQILELKRQSRFLFFDNGTFFTLICIAIASYYIPMDNYLIYIILGALIYLQLFKSMMLGLNFELNTHYIYLIPDESYKKILAILIGPILKSAFDSIFFFGLVFLMRRSDVISAVFSMLAYVAANLFFLSIKIIYQRILNGQPNKIISTLIMSILFMFTIGPIGAVVGFMAYYLPSNLIYLATLPFTFGTIIISAIILAICGNLFDKTEMVK